MGDPVFGENPKTRLFSSWIGPALLFKVRIVFLVGLGALGIFYVLSEFNDGSFLSSTSFWQIGALFLFFLGAVWISYTNREQIKIMCEYVDFQPEELSDAPSNHTLLALVNELAFVLALSTCIMHWTSVLEPRDISRLPTWLEYAVFIVPAVFSLLEMAFSSLMFVWLHFLPVLGCILSLGVLRCLLMFSRILHSSDYWTAYPFASRECLESSTCPKYSSGACFAIFLGFLTGCYALGYGLSTIKHRCLASSPAAGRKDSFGPYSPSEEMPAFAGGNVGLLGPMTE